MCILMTVAVVVNLSTEKLSQVLERVRPKFRVKIRNDKWEPKSAARSMNDIRLDHCIIMWSVSEYI